MKEGKKGRKEERKKRKENEKRGGEVRQVHATIYTQTERRK